MARATGLLAAIIDAIFGQDERIAGQATTRLTVGLSDAAASIFVNSTIGFGEFTNGTGDARVVVGKEIILASGRTDTSFTGLTRGVDGTKTPARHPAGAAVRDLSINKSALDLARRGMMVRFAIGPDLDVIGRNLGLKKCPGLDDDTWRRIIEDVAYLAKQPESAFVVALTALVGPGNFTIRERNISRPGELIIEISGPLIASLDGQFFVNGGEPQLTTGPLSVVVANPVLASPVDPPGPPPVGVYWVVDDTPLTRAGIRDGFTNYFTGGSFVGNVITLGSSPGPAGTPVIVDYNAFRAHYIAPTTVFAEDDDQYAYFSSRLDTARCLLDQVRAAGIRVTVLERATP